MSATAKGGPQLAGRLVRRLLGLERAMRVEAARRMLESMPVGETVEILAELMRRRAEGDAKALEALASVIEALVHLGEGDTPSALYAEACRRNLEGVRRLLMRPAAAKTFDPNEERSIDREMRAKTLGMRRQLARAADPVTMLRLTTDPDPGVIRNLLRHPRLTEADVVRMAARRPGRPEVLMEIFRSPKWGVRQRVRRALANNPYTPTEVALKLVEILPLTEVRGLAADGSLHEEVQRAARARLEHARRRRAVARAAAHLEDLEPEGDA
ncbi:MAG: hypothetical protein D6729_09065 [Deltaproteobacteria bacterium]|nr:MAG: hypothetical protein D6729_09065 [Deltaproteobacteria bacterium]